MTPPVDYKWHIGDVFTNGTSRWAVDAVHRDRDGQIERAVLRSCASRWATTIPLTFNEWNEDGRWRLESS